MSTILLLLQSFSTVPGTQSGVYSLPLSGIVQAVYPMGPEPAANIGGSVDESVRLGGIVGAV